MICKNCMKERKWKFNFDNYDNLRMFVLIVSAHPYCARNSHATSSIEHAHALSTKMRNDIALLGFNDLGHLVTSTFLFRNRFYLQLSPHCPKVNNKSM